MNLRCKITIFLFYCPIFHHRDSLERNPLPHQENILINRFLRHLPHRALADVGGHPQEVGDAVAQVRAEGVDKVADADMLELRDAQRALRPGLAVVKFVGLAAVDGVRVHPRDRRHRPQHLVPVRPIKRILIHREELWIFKVVAVVDFPDQI